MTPHLHGLPPKGQVPVHGLSGWESHVQSENNSACITAAIWTHSLMYFHDSVCQNSPQVPASMVSLSILPKQISRGHPGLCTSTSASVSKLVVKPSETQRSFIPDTRIHFDSYNRCIHQGIHLGHLQAQPFGTSQEVSLHINILELQAICWVWETFITSIKIQVIQVLIDGDTSAVFYLNNQGGIKLSLLCQEVVNLRNFCIKNNIMP